MNIIEKTKNSAHSGIENGVNTNLDDEMYKPIFLCIEKHEQQMKEKHSNRIKIGLRLKKIRTNAEIKSMKNVILYLRVASKNEEDLQNGFEKQEKKLRRFCANNGINIQGVIKETRSGKNRIGKEVISYLKQNSEKANTLLFDNWTIFSRNIVNAVNDIERLQKMGFYVKPVDKWRKEINKDSCMMSICDLIYNDNE